MTKTIRIFTEDECDQHRANIVENSFLPVVSEVFAVHADLQAAVVFLAQFWCDEAYDAVHYEVIYSLERNPNIASYAHVRSQSEFEDDFDFDLLWLMEGAEGATALGLAPATSRPAIQSAVVRDWDSNGTAISLFSAFTREGGDQDASFEENFVPYAIFRRIESDLSVEIVGKKLRPFLDGVAKSSQ